MINRDNYLLLKNYLKWKESSVTEDSLKRIKFYLRHLLLWADDVYLGLPEKIKGNSLQIYLLSVKTVKGSLSSESQKKILDYSRELYRWAKETYPKNFQSVKTTWIISLKPNRNCDRNIATEARTVSEQEMFSIVDKFQKSDMINDIVFRRDFAATIFLYLSGQRGGAFVTTPINAIDLTKNEVYQWPEVYGVKTKNRKRATTFLYQIPGLIEIVQDWDKFIRSVIPEKQWDTYPWYASFVNNWGEKSIVLHPIDSASRGGNLIKRFSKLFLNLDMDYKNPHSFRHGHAVYGLTHARNPAEFHAVSKNLIHDNSIITEKIYAGLELNDRRGIISNLHCSPICQPDDALLSMLKPLSQNDLLRVIRLSADLMAN